MTGPLEWFEGIEVHCARFPCNAALREVTQPHERRAGLHLFVCTAGHTTTYHNPRPPERGPLCLGCAKPLSTDGTPAVRGYHAACRVHGTVYTTCQRCGKLKDATSAKYDEECRKIVLAEIRRKGFAKSGARAASVKDASVKDNILPPKRFRAYAERIGL